MCSIKTKILLLFFIIFSAFLNCSDDEKDPIKFRVTCQGGSFNGTYELNADDPVGFGEGSAENPYQIDGSTYFFTSKKFKDLDTITIRATRANKTYLMWISILRDDEKVMELELPAEDPSSSVNTLNLKLVYNFGDEEETTTTTK